jgi:hypothetical protein
MLFCEMEEIAGAVQRCISQYGMQFGCVKRQSPQADRLQARLTIE